MEVKIMKRRISFGIICVMISLLLLGCTGTNPTSNETPTSNEAEVTAPTEETSASTQNETIQYEKLRVATFAFTEGALYGYATEKGYFKDAGLNLETVMFATGAPINEAFAAGEIDVAVSGLASVFSLALGNAKWVGEFNTAGGIGLYVRPGSDLLEHKGELTNLPNVYGNADTIRGKTFLGPLGTALQFNAVRYAAQFGLQASDIVMTHMEKGPALQAYLAGEGDVLCCDPPFSFQAEEAGLILIAPFNDVTGVYLKDGVYVRNDVLEERREEIVKFIQVMYQAAQEMQNDPDMRAEFSIKWFGENGQTWSEEDMAREMSVRDYITADTLSGQNYIMGDGMMAIGKYFNESGQIEDANLPNLAASFDPSIVKDALRITVKVAGLN